MDFYLTQVQTPGQYSYLHNCVAFYAKQIQRDMLGAAGAHQSPEYVNEPNDDYLEDEYVMVK